jgi:hypothetical protein
MPRQQPVLETASPLLDQKRERLAQIGHKPPREQGRSRVEAHVARKPTPNRG